MKFLFKAFTDHPSDVGETYFQHFKVASTFGASMFVGSLACFAHAIFPFLCTKTGSEKITRLHARMTHGRQDETPCSSEPNPHEHFAFMLYSEL